MIRSILVLVVVATVALALVVWLYQGRVVWLPPPPPYDDAVEADDVRRLEFEAPDGQPLVGWLVLPPDGRGDAWDDASDAATVGGARQAARAVPRRVVVVFHGNAEIAAWAVPWGREVARRTGWAVFAPECRGYAGLPGRPSHEGCRTDARAAYRVVRDSLGVAAGDVALYGFSLGSAVAAELAAELGEREAPRVVLLQSPFTSSADMARRMGGWPVAAIWRVVGRVPYDTRRSVARAPAPVWVIHGDRDGVIPAAMGRAVHAAARTPGELRIVPGAGHNDLLERGGEEYWAWVERGVR